MFKTVLRHIRFVDDIVASVFSFVAKVSKKVARRVKPFLPAGEKAGAAEIAAALRAVAHVIAGEARELRVAEHEHGRELKKERHLRKLRKKHAAVLYERLLRVRRTIETFGRGLAALTVGLDTKFLTAAPDVLARYGRMVVEVLSRPDFELPKRSLGGTFDARYHAKNVLTALRQYEKTKEELADQIPLTREAQRIKVQRLERFKKTYRYGKWVIQGFYGLAGEEYHLERLEPKPGTRKSKGEQEKPASETDAEAMEQSTEQSPEGDDAADRARGEEP